MKEESLISKCRYNDHREGGGKSGSPLPSYVATYDAHRLCAPYLWPTFETVSNNNFADPGSFIFIFKLILFITLTLI